LVTASVSALCACAGESGTVEVAGECADANQAQVCTWATMQGDAVVEFGATIPLAAIENAPREVAMAWPPLSVAAIDLPDAAGASGFDHMTIYWEPMGHGPATYMVPHFDFHFYTIASADRLAIDCADESKPAALPAAYSLPDEELPPEIAAAIGVSTLIGVCVPEMGMHALPTAELTNTETFNGTMVIGYYHGQNIFIEPMIAQSLLLERRSFDIPVPDVPGLEGRQPTTFHAIYNADQDAYRFVFSGMASPN